MPHPARFKGPAEFSIYGGEADGSGPVLRISGARSQAEAEEMIWDERKKRPSFSFSIWRANGWTEVKFE